MGLPCFCRQGLRQFFPGQLPEVMGKMQHDIVKSPQFGGEDILEPGRLLMGHGQSRILIELVMQADKCGTPIISSMGAGNKLDPTAFEVADIYKTSVCPLAKVMRRELKKRGIKSLKVVYSKEEPIRPVEDAPEEEREISQKRDIPGSTAFVPSVAGLIIAGEVIKDLTAGLRKPDENV